MGRVTRQLCLLSVLLGARVVVPVPVCADARDAQVERVLAAVSRDLARGAPLAAERKLWPSLARGEPDPRLLLRYLSLKLPLDGPAPTTASALATAERRAAEVLVRLAKITLSPDQDESARRAALHVAWAAALVGRYDETFAAVRAAGRQQDDVTLACLRHVAAVAALRDRLAVAADALAQAHQYVPQDVVTLAALSRVLLALGRASEAVSLLTERMTITPDDLGARRDLAYALGAAGEATQGLALLQRADAACQVADGCALEAARLALEAGRPDDAAQFAARQLARAPDDLEALYVRADAEAEAGRFAEARATWQRVLAMRPDSARAKQALAQLPP